VYQLHHIEYLIALAALPVLIIFYVFTLRWKKKTILKIGGLQLVQQLIKGFSANRFRLKFLLVLIAFTAAAIGLAGLRKPSGTATVKRTGIDVMIALDVSKSMLAQDIQPSRLERAKQLVAKLIDKLPNDRIGLVVFAGRAYLQMPLSGDHAAAKMFLSSASPDMIPTQGTVIGDALKMSYNAFNTREKKYKSIVLISDGEDHDEGADKIAVELAGEGVMINTVGIGSIEGSTIINTKTGEIQRDINGDEVITKLNETGLQNIAAKANGIYQLFNSADQVASNISTRLKGMDSRSITEMSTAVYQYFFQWFIGLAVILLLVEFFTSERVDVNDTKKKGGLQQLSKKQAEQPFGAATSVVILMVGLFYSNTASAQKENRLIKKGNELYTNGAYAAAADNYKKAFEVNPASVKAAFNLGNAFYKDGKGEEATKAFDAAVSKAKSANEKSKAWYNKGVVLQNDKKLPECISAYKNALKENSADEDARFNLQKALLQQQQEQQKQPKDQDRKKDQQQKQQPNEKEDQPKPQQSKMSKKEAEEKLKALLQQEKNLQDKLRRSAEASPNKPEKDW